MVCENRDIWVFGYIVGPDCLQHMPPRNIYGFLGTSWVLITYIICPPVIYIYGFLGASWVLITSYAPPVIHAVVSSHLLQYSSRRSVADRQYID